MKNLFIIIFIFITVMAFGQAPQAFNYQGIAVNSSGEALDNQTIGLQFTIIEGGANGTPVYTETHTASTTSIGHFSVDVGNGSTSDIFSNISFSAKNVFMKVDLDENGGNNYSYTSTIELLSVPFALYVDSTTNDPSNFGRVGAQGDAGAPGPAGATGPAGPQGAGSGAGPAGEEGAQGAQGAQGPQGPPGPNTGVPGIQGERGPDGDPGTLAGSPGVNGPNGAVGAVGAEGPQGPQGPQGLSGKEGNIGPMGDTGPASNEVGPKGPDGPAGAPGGAPGLQGPDGPSGASGPQGPQGPQGPTGVTGAAGMIGPDGLPASFSMRSTVPAPSSNLNLYLDDGTNRADGLPGLRFYNGSQWLDI